MDDTKQAHMDDTKQSHKGNNMIPTTLISLYMMLIAYIASANFMDTWGEIMLMFVAFVIVKIFDSLLSVFFSIEVLFPMIENKQQSSALREKKWYYTFCIVSCFQSINIILLAILFGIKGNISKQTMTGISILCNFSTTILISILIVIKLLSRVIDSIYKDNEIKCD